MESVTLYALVSVVAVSLISLVGIITLSWQERFLDRILFFLVSLAVGALFGDAIIHLIPEAFEGFGSATTASLFILGGILLFFALEKFLNWHHHHSTHAESEMVKDEATHKAHHLGALIFTADGLHNFIDGVIIGASYLISIEVGVATTIAIVLHEIPQEIGDFAILVHAGLSKMKALMLNFGSGLLSILGVVTVLILQSSSALFIPAATAIAAGSFLYIAGSDLVPELHKTTRFKTSLIQFFAILLGIALMWGLVFIE